MSISLKPIVPLTVFFRKARLICIIPLILIWVSGNHKIQAQNRTVESVGDVILFSLPTIVLGSTVVINDKQGTWQFSKGFILNQAVTYGLKLAVNKSRPNMENINSFPSGHTSTTFQSASFIQQRYGWKYGAPAYVLAGFTGYSRIEANKHDIVDVLMGAAIGIGSSYLFTTPQSRTQYELTFSSEDNYYVLGLAYNF